ncbi:MAG: TrkA family potassium uptake protein [Clostridia bacterium]|nr:TrkA family potassium uptake protein [Clostridia bacterium]
MYIIITGCGKVGSGLANKLSKDGHDVVVIDFDEEAFKRIDPDFSGLKLVGVPFDQDVLKKAGIDKADAVAAVTPEDNTNIMVSQIAKDIYGVPRVLARIYNPVREHVFHHFGLETICPTNLSVDIMSSILLGKTLNATCTIGSNTLSFRYQQADKAFIGQKIKDIKVFREEFLFGLIKNGEFVFAFPDTQVEKEDLLVLSRKID